MDRTRKLRATHRGTECLGGELRRRREEALDLRTKPPDWEVCWDFADRLGLRGHDESKMPCGLDCTKGRKQNAWQDSWQEPYYQEVIPPGFMSWGGRGELAQLRVADAFPSGAVPAASEGRDASEAARIHGGRPDIGILDA